MAGARAGLVLTGGADVHRTFRRIEHAGGELLPVLEEIGSKLLFTTQRRFESEVDPEGTRWDALKPSTATRPTGRGRRAKARGFDHKLRVKSRLYRSLNYKADAEGVAIGTNVKYAALHQFGGESGMPPGAAAVPARPYLGISADDYASIGQIAHDHLALALGGGA